MKFVSFILFSTCVVAQLNARYISLVEESPFLPPNHTSQAKEKAQPQPKAAKTNHFALNGISRIGDNYRFSILDKRTQKSKWVRPEEPVNGLVITSYDPDLQTIEFTWDDQQLEVQLTNNNPHSTIELTFIEPEEGSLIGSSKNNLSPSVNNSNNRYSQYREQSQQSKVADRNTNQVVTTTPVNYHRSAGSQTTKVYFSETNTNIANNQDGSDSAPVENHLDGSDALGEDLFASVELPDDIVIDTGAVQRYKVKRKNTVHNPTGKLPD